MEKLFKIELDSVESIQLVRKGDLHTLPSGKRYVGFRTANHGDVFLHEDKFSQFNSSLSEENTLSGWQVGKNGWLYQANQKEAFTPTF